MSDELLNEFIFDSRDHLGTAGAQLLELEKKSDSLAVMNALMGTLHTIKGTSGFFDLKHLYELLNRAENLLQTVREKEKNCPQKVIDLLLQVLDTVEAILDRLESGNDDNVEWIGTLTQALMDVEAVVEGAAPPAVDAQPFQPMQKSNSGAAALPAQNQDAVNQRTQDRDDFRGRISLLTIKDGQLSEESGDFLARVEGMFEAGLKGLVLDLRTLNSVSNVELKVLMASGRKQPDKTAFLINGDSQQGLERIFKVLNLDSFMNFFPDERQAVDFINGN